MRHGIGVTLALLGLLAALPAGADTLPPGEIVRDGLLVDITPSGLDFVEDAITNLDGFEVPLDPIHTNLGNFEGCDLALQISGLYVGVAFTDVQVIPDSHELAIHADTQIWINSGEAPSNMKIDFDGGLFDICNLLDMNCGFWVLPMNVHLDLRVRLDLIDPGGGQPPFLDAMVYTPEHDLNQAFSADKLWIQDCLLTDLIDILDFFGMDVVDMMLNDGGSDIFSFLEGDLPMEIEAAIEGAFDGVTLDETVDLLGVPLDVYLAPGGLMIEPQGIRVMVDAGFSAPQAACIAEFDPGGSPFTNSPWPDLDGQAQHHAGIYVSDDMVNAALYNVWRAGLLCQTLDPDAMGLPLDTSFLAMLVDEQYADRIERVWFGESKPVSLSILPRNIPYAEMGTTHDIEAGAEDLTIEVYAETMDRMAKVFDIDIDVAAGVDLAAAPDGSIDLGVEVDTENLHPAMRTNEMFPSLTPEIETNFGALLSDLMGLLLDGLLGDLSLGNLDLMGIGLSGLEIVAAGPHQDYLGLHTSLAVVDPAAMSCSGGCGDGGGGGIGCEEGCADESCDSTSCDLGQRRPVGAVWSGNVLLLLACVGVWVHLRRRG